MKGVAPGGGGFPIWCKFSMNPIETKGRQWQEDGNQRVYAHGSVSLCSYQSLSSVRFGPPHTQPLSSLSLSSHAPCSETWLLSSPSTHQEELHGQVPGDRWGPDQLCTRNGVEERMGLPLHPCPRPAVPWVHTWFYDIHIKTRWES